MFSFVRNLKLKQGLLIEAPTFLTSLVIAEVLYKFHSFTLECLAFLATWLAISAAVTGVTAVLFPRVKSESSSI